MKAIIFCLMLGSLMSSTGCMTYSAVQRAEGKPNAWSGADDPTKAYPAYWTLLPLTVPADIVTSPIQLVIYLAVRYGG